jgi:hypothetical protein
MPTYSHGTNTPEISPLSKERTEPGSLGKLFKFQPDFTYSLSVSDEFVVGAELLGKPLPKLPVSKSAPYSTYVKQRNTKLQG